MNCISYDLLFGCHVVVDCFLVVGCFYCCVSCIVWIVCDVVLLSCFGEIANMLLSHFLVISNALCFVSTR